MPRVKGAKASQGGVAFGVAPWSKIKGHTEELSSVTECELDVVRSDTDRPLSIPEADLELYCAKLENGHAASGRTLRTGLGMLAWFPDGRVKGHAKSSSGDVTLQISGRVRGGLTDLDCMADPDSQLIWLDIEDSLAGKASAAVSNSGGDVARLVPFDASFQVQGRQEAACELSFECETLLDGSAAEEILLSEGLHEAVGRGALVNKGCFEWSIAMR